uniref:Uncharacterized protein n=1 Tax=Triticum urartu TaxID=4572 RepID=A0A8R7K4N5_TRIUA
MNQVVASLMGIVDGARQKGVFVADAASINIGMSVAIFIICVCNLALLVAVILMRAQE